MPELRRLFWFWAVVLAAGSLGALALGRYGANVLAFALLYAALATSWSWLRATGLFSFGHAAFFGGGALAYAWLVGAAVPPWLALGSSAAAGALVALPLIPALRLAPASFALATLAYAVLLRGLAANVPIVGPEGFLLPSAPAFELVAPALLAALAAGLSFGYQIFLGTPSGRGGAAIRQAPETALSIGVDYVGERWRPLVLNGAATAVAGALYAELVGSVETVVVFSPIFSVLPLVLAMLGGALHPLGGVVGTLALYPVDELLLRPALPQGHALAYGLALVALLTLRPEGLLGARVPRIAAPSADVQRAPRAAPRAASRAASRAPLALAARRLAVRRNGSLVLHDVNVAIAPGQILRLAGPNGAGKSSLLLALAGALPAAEGAVLFDGEPAPRRPAARVRRGLARTLQAPQAFPDWTVRENVGIAAERAGGTSQVDRLLRELELTSLQDRPAGQLSVGEGKRLEMARALALRPAILLLDEPLAGLSPDTAAMVSRLVERARDEGAAIVWAEHGSAAGAPADQLLVLDEGRVRYYGAAGRSSVEKEAAGPGKALPSSAEWEAARRAPPA